MASPYELLAGLALLREKKRGSNRTQALDLKEWSGFRVQIGKMTCLIPCDQVEEVMTPTTVAVARGVPAWLCGVAYFRAQLVTLVDIAGLLLSDMKPSTSATRVFVIRGKQEWFGLQVNVFEGVRHIWSDTATTLPPKSCPSLLLKYVRDWLYLDGEIVAVLDATQLIHALETGGGRV